MKKLFIFRRALLVALTLTMSVPILADQGYAVISDDGKTLTFYYGTPSGTAGTDYYNTDNTGTSGPGWYSKNNNFTTVVFDPSFANARPTSCKAWFIGFINLTSISGIEYLNTSNVTDMSQMFSNCPNLSNLDVRGFDTSNVTLMYDMFNLCSNLTSLDVSGFNTSNVTNMSTMFSNCPKLTSLDLSNFDTSNVTSMQKMFYNCSGLTYLDVSNFDTRTVNQMGNMFRNCSGLTSLTFSKNFDTGLAANTNYWYYPTSINNIFSDATNLRYIDFYASDDTDAITSVDRSSGMFNGLPATTVIYLPHGSSEVTDATNVVYSYGGDATDLRCPVYYSADATDIELPRSFKTNSAQYTRTMSNTYGSVILPYAFTTNDNIQAYVQDSEYPEMMYFKDTQTVPAHTPFAFKKLSDGTTADFTMTDTDDSFGITVEATRSTLPTETTWDGNAGAPYSDSSVAVNVDGWTTRGYYINQTLDDWSDTYYIAGDKFYKADGQITVKPHRVSFHNPSSHAAMYGIGSIPVYDDNDDTEEPEVVDAIKAAETRRAVAGAQTVYDASGRQVSQPMKGLNIIRMSDGSMKKVIMK